MGDELKLTKEEVARLGANLPPVLSPAQAAAFIGIPKKTIYEWSSQNRLDSCARRRGKHLLIFRDRLIEELFDGKDW